MTDDPNVFIFNKNSGFIDGPSNFLKNIPLGPGISKKDDYKSEQLDPVAI